MEIIKRDITSSIEKIFKTLNIGSITNIELLPSSENTVYKVTTEEKNYVVKKYSKDSIKNEKDLNKRKKQISISKTLKENGIPTILPLEFDDKYFILHRNTYFLIYDYYPYKSISSLDMTSKKIKKLAKNLAIIHNLNLKSDLPCQYHQINIDFNKYLKKYKNIDETLYKTLYENYFILEDIVKECNQNIKYVENNLCISHNDYKLENILWDKDYMYLIDYDACAMSNPSVSLAESAFSLSKQENIVNKTFYSDFLKSYLKKYGPLVSDYKNALKVALNGKLQWLEYLMSKCNKKDKQITLDTINMIKELVLYNKNEEEFYNIYLRAVKK